MTNVIAVNFKQHTPKPPEPVRYAIVPAWIIADPVLNRKIMAIQERGGIILNADKCKHWEDLVVWVKEANIRCCINTAFNLLHRESYDGGDAA